MTAKQDVERLIEELQNAQGGMHANCQTPAEKYKCERGSCACFERHVDMLNRAAALLRSQADALAGASGKQP
jgi:hypothetical protein